MVHERAAGNTGGNWRTMRLRDFSARGKAFEERPLCRWWSGLHTARTGLPETGAGAGLLFEQ
jgi:hypothetical protein